MEAQGWPVLETIRTVTNQKSIHDKESIEFYEKDLGANKWVIDLLTNYHKIPFTAILPKYQEKNNKSAIKEKEILWSTM